MATVLVKRADAWAPAVVPVKQAVVLHPPSPGITDSASMRFLFAAARDAVLNVVGLICAVMDGADGFYPLLHETMS